MAYIDGFVAAVPTANREAYREHAEVVAELFRASGALRVVECWGDAIPDGEVTSFPLAVQCKPDETVVFSWIEWPSKVVRDAGMEKVLADPKMSPEKCPMPFDGQRLIYGSFRVLVER